MRLLKTIAFCLVIALFFVTIIYASDITEDNYDISELASLAFNCASSGPEGYTPYIMSRSSDITTTDGTPIGAEVKSETMTEAVCISAENYFRTYEGLVFDYYDEDDIGYTSTYNCHYYAWCADWCTSPYWVGYAEPFVYDVHTYTLKENEEPQIGDIVTYWVDGATTHSAIVHQINGDEIICRSKWGEMGIYVHNLEQVPSIYIEYDTNGNPNVQYHRYTQGEHFLSIDEYNGENGHTIKCTAEKSVNGVYKTCSYTTECTSTATCISYNSSQHYVSCSVCGCSGYFYHNYYVYADNGEDGYTIKCYDCPYTIDCGHSVEYEIDGDMCHNITCMDCNYSAFEVHTYEQTGEYNSSGHEIECIYCYYSEYVDHDLYMYSAETEDYTVKCRDCNYSVRCVESPEYYGDSDDGHWVDCPDGCYSFYEPHTPDSYEDIDESSHEVVCADCGYTYYEDHNYGDCYHTASANYHYYECVDCGYEYAEQHLYRSEIEIENLFSHIIECTICGYESTEAHTWVSAGLGYRCTVCGMLSDSVPGIMSLPDPELEAYLASLSVEEREELIASLPEDQVDRVTALLPSDDEHLTE